MNDLTLKLFLGRILGEIYQSNHWNGFPVPVSQGTIYGLVNGVEIAIDDVLAQTPLISLEHHDRLGKILENYFQDWTPDRSIRTLEEIEVRAKAEGISKDSIFILLAYWLNNSRYTEMLQHFDFPAPEKAVVCKTETS